MYEIAKNDELMCLKLSININEKHFLEMDVGFLLAVLTVLPLGKTNKYFETFDRLCLMCVFLITIRSIISSKLFPRIRQGKIDYENPSC